MSITEELRNLAVYLDSAAAGKSEHGFSPVALRLNRIADQIDEALESYYIQLPKDADGETIRVGDELEFRNGDRTMRGTVQALSDCWVVFGEGPYYGVKSCRHVKPDSWERIISDATALGAQMKRRTYQIGDFVERCKRLAGEDA